MKVAFLRGVNVGGRNPLPMKELVALLEALGCTNVRTHLQSGNAVFDAPDGPGSPDLGGRIADAVEEAHGFRPPVSVLNEDELQRAIAANPFPQAAAAPKSLHLFFPIGAVAEPDLGPVREVATPTEEVVFADGVLYLHTPDGFGRSKAAARVERVLGDATGRNWRTMTAVLDLVRGR